MKIKSILMLLIITSLTACSDFSKQSAYYQENPRVEYTVYTYPKGKKVKDMKKHINKYYFGPHTHYYFYYEEGRDIEAIKKADYTYDLLRQIQKNPPDTSFTRLNVQGIEEGAMFYLDLKFGD